MQQKFRMFLYIIRPIGIRVKICDYVNQNTAHSRGIDLSERTVLEMSVITKAGLLALAAAITWIVVTVRVRGAHDPEYLKLYAQTDAFAKEVADYEEKLNSKSQKSKKSGEPKNTAAEEADGGVEVVEIENFEGEAAPEETVDDGTRLAGDDPVDSETMEEHADGEDY